jgi:hypothetical protein
MKFPSKTVIIPMAAVAIVAAGAFGVARVSAATDANNPQASLVQKIADTFHLDKSKVQSVFDQDKQQRQDNREAQYEARLTQAVTDGKLTSAQKDAVLKKHNELKDQLAKARTSGQSLTPAERKAAMDKLRADIDAWSKANNIDAKWLMGGGPGFGGHGGRGHMGPGMMGPRPAGDQDDATASPSTSS